MPQFPVKSTEWEVRDSDCRLDPDRMSAARTADEPRRALFLGRARRFSPSLVSTSAAAGAAMHSHLYITREQIVAMAMWANVESLRLVSGPLLTTDHLCKQEILLAPLFTVSFTLYYVPK